MAKFIATSNFANNMGLELESPIHPGHVHKGAFFSVGDKTPLDKLVGRDLRLVAELNRVGRIADANNAEHVQKIQAEVKAETESFRLQKEQEESTRVNNADLIRQFIAAFKVAAPARA